MLLRQSKRGETRRSLRMTVHCSCSWLEMRSIRQAQANSLPICWRGLQLSRGDARYIRAMSSACIFHNHGRQLLRLGVAADVEEELIPDEIDREEEMACAWWSHKQCLTLASGLSLAS